jgi:hypothetical protein
VFMRVSKAYYFVTPHKAQQPQNGCWAFLFSLTHLL